MEHRGKAPGGGPGEKFPETMISDPQISGPGPGPIGPMVNPSLAANCTTLYVPHKSKLIMPTCIITSAEPIRII